MSISHSSQSTGVGKSSFALARKSAHERAAFADAPAESLVGGELTRWLAIELDDRAVLVKSNARRRIYRVAQGGKTLFVKQHLLRGPVAFLKCLLAGSPARGEFHASGYAQEHGVPAVRMLAYAARRKHWNPHVSITVAEAVEDAQPLTATFTARASTRTAVDALASSVARLCATAHDQAFLHGDAHPGNILVQAANGTFACRYVDLQGVRCGRAVNDADAARNLAEMDQWFQSRASATDRLRFLKRYAGQRGKWTSRAALRAMVERIAARRRRHAADLYRKRDRRIGWVNAFFDCQVADDGAEVVSTLRFRRAGALLGIPLLGTTPDSREAGNGDSGPGSAETFFASGRVTSIAWRLWGSPAWRRYESACVLMNRDLPTVVPLACREVHDRIAVTQCGWRWQRPVDGATLHEWLDAAIGKSRCELLDAVGRLLADTLARGVVVRNPNATHLEVAGMLRGAPVVYWAGVEVETARVPAPRHAGVWMLARLAADAGGTTRADRARVVRACCRRFGMRSVLGDWKGVWREVVRLIG